MGLVKSYDLKLENQCGQELQFRLQDFAQKPSQGAHEGEGKSVIHFFTTDLKSYSGHRNLAPLAVSFLKKK